MAITKERIDLSEIPEKEQRFLGLPSYSRDHIIPGWADVIIKFKLNELHSCNFRLLREYYRAQRKIAEGRRRKAKRIFKGLDRNPDF